MVSVREEKSGKMPLIIFVLYAWVLYFGRLKGNGGITKKKKKDSNITIKVSKVSVFYYSLEESVALKVVPVLLNT